MQDKNKSKELLIKELETLKSKYKQVEKTLQETQEKYRSLVESTDDSIYLIDRDYRYLLMNKIHLSRMGFQKEEYFGQPYSKFHSPEETMGFNKKVDTVFETGQSVHHEHVSQRDNKYFLRTLSPVKDSGGRIIAVTVVSKNITHLKKAEEALHHSEERFKQVANSAGEWIWEVDNEGLYTYSSPVVENVLGYKPEEIVGKKHFYDLFTHDVREDLKKASFEVFSRKEEFRNFVNPNIHKNGKIVIFEKSGMPILDKEGNLLGYRGADTDITERKNAEALLLEREKFLRDILDSIQDGISILDKDLNIMLVNPIIEKWYAHKLPLVGKKCYEAYHGRTEHCDICPSIETLMSGKKSYEVVPFTGPEGFRGWQELHTFPYLDSKTNNLIGVIEYVRDITDQKKMEEELLKSQKIESIGILAGGIAHDFNNLLQVIIGNISLASMYIKPGNDIHERLNKAEIASQQAQELSYRLLTFSKGGEPLRKVTLISKILKETVRFSLSGSNISFKLNLQDDLYPVEIDESQISQAINNLIINAKESMPRGGIIKVTAKNEKVTQKKGLPLTKGDYIKISIEDQGTGIPSENLSKIFDLYFTTKDITRQKGSGLGLAICHSIITKHDGRILIDSEEGVGTTVHIYLPATKKQVIKKKKREKERQLPSKGRILVMDDEEIVRETIGEMLKHLNYEVEHAIEGNEAIELYRQAKESGKSFDAVILDLTIPGGMGGKQAIKKLIEIDPEVKGIVTSGYTDDSIIIDYTKYGFIGSISKPYNFKQLNEILSKVIS